MPFSLELFTALGYEKVDEEKFKYAKENFSVLKSILNEVKAYKEKYEQVPEESLKYVMQAEEEDKKRRNEIDKLEVFGKLYKWK